jgi:hypothetical protein
MKRTFRILSVALLGGVLAGFLSGCGTIIHGGMQDIGINSTPTGATIYVNGQTMGRTPAITKLSRKNTQFVKIELEGYQPFEITLNRGVSGWVFGNIVFGGLIGLVVDASTGAMYKLTPEQVSGAMQKMVAIENNEDAMFITVALTADPSWEKVASLTPTK